MTSRIRPDESGLKQPERKRGGISAFLGFASKRNAHGKSTTVNSGDLLHAGQDRLARRRAVGPRQDRLCLARGEVFGGPHPSDRFSSQLRWNPGARIGEILPLRWEHCDDGFVTFLRTKSGKPRRFQISPVLRDVFDEQTPWTPWVFPNPRTRRPYTTVMGSFRRALDRAEIRTGDVTLHTLRHTALSRMIESGIDDYTVMEISGHSSTRMLARYTHPTELRKQAALESFSVVTEWSHREVEDEKRGGGPHGIRTHDLRVANAALSQLS